MIQESRSQLGLLVLSLSLSNVITRQTKELKNHDYKVGKAFIIRISDIGTLLSIVFKIL